MAARIKHVDVAKGITILLVALYHSNLRSYAPEVMNSMGLFRLPLFFFLSGIFFNPSNSLQEFIAKKSDALLKPYFVTSILWIIFSLIRGDELFTSQFKFLLYGNGDTIICGPLWFLTHLWSIFVFAYLIFKITKMTIESKAVLSLVIVVLILIGSNFIDLFWHTTFTLAEKKLHIPGLPFSLDILFVSTAFFLSGTMLKTKILEFRPSVWLFISAAAAFTFIALFTPAHIDLNHRMYQAPLFATIGAACGIYLILCASIIICKIKVLNSFFLICGSSSLFILLFHSPFGSLAYRLLSNNTTPAVDVYVSLLAFFISIFMPLLIKSIVAKSNFLMLFYMPLQSNRMWQSLRRVSAGAD